jgi:uncharacterized protein involved in exopolysaccharide biosynthesis/Mrp family chromosome partitioning ATPase
MSATGSSSTAASANALHGEEHDAVSAPRPFFADLLHLAQRRFNFILLMTACFAAAVTVLAYLWPPSYSSSAEVVFDQRANKAAVLSTVAADLPDSRAELPNDPSLVQNQLRVLSSRNLAARVVEKLGLSSDPELGAGSAQDTPQIAHDRVIDAFLRRLSVQPLGLSTAFSITYTSRDPQTASAVANAVADAYIASQIEAKAAETHMAVTWLSQRVRELAIETQNAEGAVQAYKREHNLSEAADGTPLIDQQVLAVQTELMQARATLAEKQAVQNRLRTLSSSDTVANMSEVSASPIIVQLRLQETDLARQESELAMRYGPKHPKYLAIDTQLKSVREKIASEIARIGGGMESDVIEAMAQVRSLQAGLADVEREAAIENAARGQLESLVGNAKSTRTAYEAFVSRLREVQGQDAMQLADASIISRAPVPSVPNPPRRSIIALASIPAGLLLSLLVVLLQERGISTPAYSPRPRVPLNAPILARIPDLARRGMRAAEIADSVVKEPMSAFARGIAQLDTSIGAVRTRRAKIIGVTSPLPGDGKTIVAAGAARAAARRGLRVVLIDCDPAQQLARTLQLEPGKSGLFDLLSDSAALSSCVRKDGLSGALTVFGGQVPRHFERMLGSPKMSQLIEYLRGTCDLVILDLPGALTRGPHGLGSFIDGLILVLGWNGTAFPGVAEVNAFFAEFGKPGIGVVVSG